MEPIDAFVGMTERHGIDLVVTEDVKRISRDPEHKAIPQPSASAACSPVRQNGNQGQSPGLADAHRRLRAAACIDGPAGGSVTSGAIG